jgi:hypothetical protein
MLERYAFGLGEAGRQKLRATALLAEGGAERAFEAAVLFHDAARAEERSLLALDSPAPEVRLASAIEQCVCFIEGLDPIMAARAWGRVLGTAREVPTEAAALLLSRLEPRYLRLEASFRSALRTAALVSAYRDSMALLKGPERGRFRTELTRLLAQFPGTADLWWTSFRLEETRGRPRAAWTALVRASRLDPENGRYEALRLCRMPPQVSQEEAAATLSKVYASLPRAAPEVCLMYAFKELELARRVPREAPERLQRALEAIIQGRSRSEGASLLGRLLQATQFLVSERLKGAEPLMELLYRAGLGELLISAPHGEQRDPLKFLTREALQTLVQRAA